MSAASQTHVSVAVIGGEISLNQLPDLTGRTAIGSINWISKGKRAPAICAGRKRWDFIQLSDALNP